MSSNREKYTSARDMLLTEVTTFLEDDPRFVAAWLAGSFGRGEQNWLSDLDIHVVVAEEYSETLCATPQIGKGCTTPEHLALLQQFGTPVIVFEAHSNNQIGGTFTHVVYRESAQNIDWMLIPQRKAYREQPSLVLFDKVKLPEAPEPVLLTHDQAVNSASDAIAFFWMIAAGSAKELEEGIINFHTLLSWLKDSIRKVKYALELKEPPYKHDWPELCCTLAERIAALRQVCNDMEALMPAAIAFGCSAPSNPREVVEKRLALFEEQ